MTMVTTHSNLSTSWVGETASNKGRERQTLTFRLQTLVFYPDKNRPLSEGNDCSCKPPTHRPQHVCEEHTFTCVHGDRRCSQDRGDEGKPQEKRQDKIRQDTYFQLRHSACISHHFPKKHKKNNYYAEKYILHVVLDYKDQKARC